MTTKRYLIGCFWTVLAWSLLFFLLSAPPADFPYCATYDEC